jgi:hypothetical protein
MTKRRLLPFQWADISPFSELFDDIIPYRKVLWDKGEITKNDFLYFGGGTDVDPELYGEERGLFSDTPDFSRDLFERQAFKDHLGKCGGYLGVCRGSQFLTVMAGGKLIQHCTGHAGPDHYIQTHDGRPYISVTSTHHQMMFPFGMPVNEWELIAWAPERLSNVYMNGDNDKIDVDNILGFKEPEVVWYSKIKGLAIQGHPEYLAYNHEYPTYCRSLIKKYLFA